MTKQQLSVRITTNNRNNALLKAPLIKRLKHFKFHFKLSFHRSSTIQIENVEGVKGVGRPLGGRL